MIRLFNLILIFVFIGIKGLYSNTLDCNFDDYSRSTYKTNTAKSWVPSFQTHMITNNSIIWTEKGITGQITENSNEKIKWNYKAKRKTTSGSKNRTEWRFIFFKSNKKVAAEVIFPSYRNIENLWGRCSLNTVAVSNNSNSQKTSTRLTNSAICNLATEGSSGNKLWRTYNHSKEYVEEAKRRGLNCGINKKIYEASKNSDFKRLNDLNNIGPKIQDEIDNKKISDKGDFEICNHATKNKKWDYEYAPYIEEAKRRGLNCGVEEDEAEKKRVAEEKARQERIKAEQDRIKKKEEARKKKIAEAKARQKKIAKENARQNKKAEELAKKKKLAEEKQKQELARAKLNKKIANYKRKAKNFYKDIEEFVKSGGDVDLVSLSDFFDVKPNPQNKWNALDLSNYKKLREFMISIPQFVSYEKERIGKRLKSSFAMKDQSIEKLEKNLSELKSLMRKMFGSSEVPKIKEMIKDIQSTLSNFNQLAANKVISQSSTYLASKSSKPKEEKGTTKVALSLDTNWSNVEDDLTIQQQQFCQLTDRFYDNLNRARTSKNEIKVNMVHKERQENLDALIPRGNINNWIFKVIKIDQVEDGSAAVVLGLQCKSFVGSGQTIDTKRGMSRTDKKEWRATIPYNDRRFRELAKLDQGQFIVGSGTMLEIKAYRPGQKETFYASQQIGEHPLTKGLNLEGELFIADLSYIAALN
jgi:hypothetical protein